MSSVQKKIRKLIFVGLLSLALMLVGIGVTQAAVTVSSISVVSDGALTLTGATASTWSTTDGLLTITGNDGITLTASTTAGVTINTVDNIDNALDIQDGAGVEYINIVTTDSSENISFGNATTNPSYSFLGTGAVTITGTGGSNILTVSNGDAVLSDGSLTITDADNATSLSLTNNTITTATLATLSSTSLTTGIGLDITSTSTAGGGSGNTRLINLARSGTNSNASHTAYGIYSAVTNTGTTSTNTAAYLTASGATTNYALQTAGIIVPVTTDTDSIGRVTNMTTMDQDLSAADASFIGEDENDALSGLSVSSAGDVITFKIYV